MAYFLLFAFGVFVGLLITVLFVAAHREQYEYDLHERLGAEYLRGVEAGKKVARFEDKKSA